MKIQLKNESKGSAGATPYFQVAKKAQPQKRKGEGQPVGFVSKKAKAAPAPAAIGNGGNGNGSVDPMQMMQLFMQMMQMQMSGGGADADAGAAAPAGGGAPDTVWKSKFHELLAKNHVEGKPEYGIEEVEGGGYKGIVALQEHTFQSSTAKSKKEAHQLAAKAAIQQLFPDDFAKLSSPNASKAPRKGQAPKGKTELEGKNLLNHCLNMYMRKTHQRPVLKEDMKFETEQVAGAGYVSTLVLGEGLANKSFQGEGKTKKDAENAAANAAVQQLQDIFMPIEEERQAEKKRKNTEALAKLKENHGKKSKQLAIV